MTQNPDLAPAADRVTSLLRGVSDDQLTGPTPCPAYAVADLIDHIGGLALGFAWAAARQSPPDGQGVPSGDARRLPADWREVFPERLGTMARAWQDPAAWDGMTQAGGVDLPGQVAGCVAVDELLVHGWDLAVATGQPYEADPALIQAALAFVGPWSVPGNESQRSGVFGPVVTVGDDATALDRLIGLPAATRRGQLPDDRLPDDRLPDVLRPAGPATGRSRCLTSGYRTSRCLTSRCLQGISTVTYRDLPSSQATCIEI